MTTEKDTAMKRWVLTLGLILSFFAPCWAQGDAAILARLNEGRKRSERLKMEHIRVIRPDSFKGVTVVGVGDKDRPFLLARVLFEDESLVPRRAAGKVLRSSGWLQAEVPQREELAGKWLSDVMWAFGEGPLESGEGYDFGKRGLPEFKAPAWRRFPDGSLRYSAWMQQATRGALSLTFRRMIYHFDSQGELVLVKMTNRIVFNPES